MKPAAQTRGGGKGEAVRQGRELTLLMGLEPFEFHGLGTFCLVTSFLSSPGSPPIPDV